MKLGFVREKVPHQEMRFKDVLLPDIYGMTVLVADVHVLPFPKPVTWKRRERFSLRVNVICPACKAEMSFGRIAQHYGSKKCLEGTNAS